MKVTFKGKGVRDRGSGIGGQITKGHKAHRGNVQDVQDVLSARQAGFVQIEKDNETLLRIKRLNKPSSARRSNIKKRGARAMMKFKFEELEVWHLSLELIDEVYDLLGNYPNDERFDLVRQGRKSVTSISLNIAEGSIRGKKEFRQFLRIALGSLVETIANLRIGVRRKYITQEDLESVQSIEPLYFKLIKLRKSLQ